MMHRTASAGQCVDAIFLRVKAYAVDCALRRIKEKDSGSAAHGGGKNTPPDLAVPYSAY